MNDIKKVNLDLSRLYGFKIVQAKDAANSPSPKIGAKVGMKPTGPLASKVGLKPGSPLAPKIGGKVPSRA